MLCMVPYMTIEHALLEAGSPAVRHRDRHVLSVPCSHARLRRLSKRSMASRTNSARLVCSASANRSSAASWLFPQMDAHGHQRILLPSLFPRASSSRRTRIRHSTPLLSALGRLPLDMPLQPHWTGAEEPSYLPGRSCAGFFQAAPECSQILGIFQYIFIDCEQTHRCNNLWR